MNKNFIKKTLNLTIKTWISESNGIYNYKSEGLGIREMKEKFNESCYIIREENNISIIKQNYKYNDEIEGQILFYIRKSLKDNNNFEIVNPIKKASEKNVYNIDDINRRPWLIVNSKDGICNENEEYNLNENDIIKLGRKKYEIIKKNININEINSIASDSPEEYNISKMNKERGSIFNIDIKKNQYELKDEKIEIKKDDSNNINFCKSNSIDKEGEPETEIEKCRICFETNSTKENPKIKLCYCNDFVHFECLKVYLNTKTVIFENEKNTIKRFICNRFNCEICLKPYPLRFRIPEFNKIYELIDLNMPSEIDYIILESLDFIKDNNNLKNVYIVTLNGDEINIGRYDTNDIIESDISVSRNHAILKFNKKTGKLHLVNLAKFGTLILIKGNIKMKEKNIHIQVGKSHIQANLTEDSTSHTLKPKSKENLPIRDNPE